MTFNTRSIFITAITLGVIACSGAATAAQSPRSGSTNSGVNAPATTDR